MLWLDPGLGKSSITLAALKALKRGKAIKRTLVVAPLRVCHAVWTHDEGGELAKWSDFADLRVALLHGKEKGDRAADDADLYVVNFDGLQWLTACEHCGHQSHHHKCKERGCECRERDAAPLDDLLRRGVDCLVVDELSKMKHPKTRRFKALKPFLSKFRRRIGLTGSPASNGLMGLFGQAFTIDLGCALGTSITRFRWRYFTPTGYGGYQWVPKSPDTEAEIHEAMKGLALARRVTDGDVDMPELTEQELWVDLPPDARRHYDELHEELFTLIDEREVTAANAAVASNKCRQVASGGLYSGEGKARQTIHLHDAKTEALTDLVDELQGSPLLVAYDFRHDLERIRAALGKDVPAIAGGTDARLTADIIARWNKGRIPVLLGHPKAMAHGINLQGGGARHVCFYTTPWDFEEYDQLIRRVWRQGNVNKRVVVLRIAARKTVDAAVLRALKAKNRGQAALFEALKSTR